MSDKNETTSETNQTAPQENIAAESVNNRSGAFSLNTVIAQAKQVITDPGRFYRSMNKSGGFSEPLIFALVMGAISGAVYAVLSIIGLTGLGAAGLGAIIYTPIAVLIGSFISAAIMFVIWKLMGSPENYQTAYRCMAYATAILPVVTVVAIIPYLGTVVRVVWGIWLVITASTEVHGRTKQSATRVFGILGAIGLLMGLSGEVAQRNLQAEMGEQAEQMENRLKSLENLGIGEDGEIDPQQMGRSLGAFMKGVEEAAGRTEEAEAAREPKPE